VLDREASAIEFSGSQGGSVFEGRFERWTVDIRLDPENIEEARIEAQIETASATDGNALHDRTLAESEWFDPDTYPYARYRSTEIESLAEGGYRIAGVLTIKNNDITVPSLRLTLNGDTATIRGQTVVDRAAADLGMSSDPEGEWVSGQIKVNVNAVLSRP
jgi:cytochrome b561